MPRRQSPRRADALSGVSARRPGHSVSTGGRSATAAKPERAPRGGSCLRAMQAPAAEQGLVTPCSQYRIVQLAPGIELVGIGVDTASFCFRPQCERLWARLTAPLADDGLLECCDPATGELTSSRLFGNDEGHVLVDGKVAGGRLGYYPSHRLIYVEGRLAALSALDDAAIGLARPWQVQPASRLAALAASRFLRSRSLVEGECSLRRLDLACDLRFTGPDGKGGGRARGLRFMRALGALEVPRRKSVVVRMNGQTQTVSQKTPVRFKTTIRCYDKGVEAGTHPAGELIRIEQELRWRGAERQPDPIAVPWLDLGQKWIGALKAWEGVDEIVVADLTEHENLLIQRVEEGALAPTTFTRLLGILTSRAHGLDRAWWVAQGKAYQWSRDSRLLRAHGIVLDDDGLPTGTPRDTLPLGRVLRAARAAWPSPIGG